MQSNIKATLSISKSTNDLAEKLKDELHISKSEVFAEAMKLLAKERRMAKIRKGCAEMADYYKTDKEAKALVEFVGDYHEAV